LRNKIIKGGFSVCLLTGAFYFAVRDIDTAQLEQAFSNLSFGYVAAPTLAIIVSSLFASLRVRSIARALGYPLSLRDAVAVLSLGQLGGALFFQVFGQLMARGSYLTRRNVPFAGTVIITGQERIAAALVSLCLAVVGALYLFRQVTFDLASGGLDLIRIVIGLTFAAGVVAIVWRVPVKQAAAQITKAGVTSVIRAVAFSAAVQITMMVAYVSAAKALAPHVALMDLAAAATLVMFAASIPISFAGWGVREMSAVGALGVIGISAPAALSVAITIGALSIICAGLLAAGSVTRAKTDGAKPVQAVPVAGARHEAVLSAVLPILVACLVFFQIHIPTHTTAINFNVADPFAIICGVIFLLQIRSAGAPKWRISGLHLHVLACTAVFTLGLFIGAASIGWTTWAVVNKYLGWFVLLSYGAAGAMAARVDLDKTLLTFAAAGCSVVIFAIGNMLLGKAGVVNIHFFHGFAQNTNALAFLCLMMLAVGLTLKRYMLTVTTLALIAIILTGSRAGLGAAAAMLIVASIFIPEVWRSAILAVSIAGLTTHALTIVNVVGTETTLGTMTFIRPSSDAEHVDSVRDGLLMFEDHPIFGAGLGVFIEQWRGAYPVIIHNSLVWLLAEFGLVGALAFFVPAIRIVAQELSRYRSNDTAGYLLILILAGFGAMSLFHELLYQRAMWFLLGTGLICIDRPKPLSDAPRQMI
jgi:O-antigen ligase